MPTKTIDSADPIIQQLNALAESSPDLAEMARSYQVILHILRDAYLPPTKISIIPEQARARLESGLPLLDDRNVAWDNASVTDLMKRLAVGLETLRAETKTIHRLPWARETKSNDAMSANAVQRAAAAREIRLALERGDIPMGELIARVFQGDDAFVVNLAQRCQLDPHLLRTLAQYALKPTLRAWCRELAPLSQGIEWQKGYCYVCGNPATLGELQGNDQNKHLRCGQCGADWEYRRMQCMYCGNQDHTKLGYFYPEEQREKMRIEVCDQCGGYLKVISSFSPTPPEMLHIQDLATLHLDFVAQERGYARVAIQ